MVICAAPTEERARRRLTRPAVQWGASEVTRTASMQASLTPLSAQKRVRPSPALTSRRPLTSPPPQP